MALSETEFVFAPRIPRGLGSAVEGLAREILRHRPRDIYAFAAHHFEELVKLREKERDAAPAGIVSTTTYDCDSTRNGSMDRILFDWTSRDNDSHHDSKDHRDHSRTRKIVDFIEETAIKELVAPATMSKLSKRRKEGTTCGSGWSINQTVRAFKRYEYESVIETRKLDGTRMSEKPVEKDIHGYLEKCTPRSSSESTHGQFLRSSSAGEVLAKAIKCQVKENREKFCNSVSGKYATDSTAGERECEENYGNVTTLKRQKSADQIERNEDRYVADSRQTHSPTNGRSKRDGTDTEQGFDIFRNRQDRPRPGTCSSIGDQRIENKDLEGTFRHAEAVVEKLNLKPEKDEEESKSNEQGRTFDCESRCDLTRTDIFEDLNEITVNRKITGDTWSVNRRHSLENSIVFPSVVARPSSSNGYSRNGSRNYVYGSRDENSHSNDLILPPISSDVSKPIKKEDTLTLPCLPSKTMEVEASQRATISSDHRDSNIENEKGRLKAGMLPETCNPEAVNCDYESVSARRQAVDPNTKIMGNEGAEEKDKAVSFASEGFERSACRDQTDEISVLTQTDEREVLQELEMARLSKLSETDVDESFKDSLNVTPDSIELSQRSDSLEHLKDKNSFMMVDNEEEGEMEGERNEEELLEYRHSNELKNKLIEIETVERNIENTLVSSAGTVLVRNEESPMPSTTVRSSLCSSGAAESSCLLGNETILCTGTRKRTNSEEDSTINEDTSQHRNVSVETERTDKKDVGNDSSGTWKSCSSEGTDVDRPNVRGTSEKPSKGMDLSCYVLTEGSPCEIPESVTTVIISDKMLQQRGDAVSKSDQEAIENDVCSKRRISLWNREMWQVPQEQFQHGKDPFGEYVCPEAGIRYSTSVDLDFLGGTKNAVDRSTTCQNLGDIKEEEENEREVSNKDNARSTVLSADVVDSYPSEKISVAIESETDTELGQLTSKTISWNGFDQSDVEVRMPSSVTNMTGVQAKPLRRDKDTRAEAVSTEITVHSKEHGEASTFKHCSRDRSPPFDATGPPYVPELNLDSLRDVTISSFERSDSRNNVNQSDKENNDDDGDDDDITFHEGGQTLSSIDTLSSGKKAIIDQHLPSKSKLVVGVEELSNVREDAQTKIENEIGECIDSPSTEEEIARELIQNLTLETPILGEIHETENMVFIEVQNNSSLSDYTNRTDRADLQIEFDPLVYKIPSPVTIGSVGVASTLCLETGTSYQPERMNIEFQGERKEEEEEEGGGGGGGGGGADVNAECYSTSETSIDEFKNDVSSFACNSTRNFLETATEFDNVPKDQDQYEKSEIKGNSREDAKEILVDRNVQNETLDAAVRKIQVWTREFVLGQRRPTRADGHPNPIRDLNMMSTLTRRTSEAYVEESPFSNDQRHERSKDRAQSKEFDRFEKAKAIRNEGWSMDGKIEINRIDASTTTCSDFRQTGEFHDSLPLPLLEVARSKIPSKDVFTLSRVYESRNGNLGFSLEPDTSTFGAESPRASVLCTVDLSETLRLIGNASDWSNSPCSKFPFCLVHVERVSGETDALPDDTTVSRFARRFVNSGTDELSLVREPLALVDETPKSILIEEISNSDEENDRTSSHLCGTVIDLATIDSFDPEKHSDRNDGKGKTKTSRDALSAYETVRTDNNDSHTELPLDSSVFENHENVRDESELEENTVTKSNM